MAQVSQFKECARPRGLSGANEGIARPGRIVLVQAAHVAFRPWQYSNERLCRVSESSISVTVTNAVKKRCSDELHRVSFTGSRQGEARKARMTPLRSRLEGQSLS